MIAQQYFANTCDDSPMIKNGDFSLVDENFHPLYWDPDTSFNRDLGISAVDYTSAPYSLWINILRSVSQSGIAVKGGTEYSLTFNACHQFGSTVQITFAFDNSDPIIVEIDIKNDSNFNGYGTTFTTPSAARKMTLTIAVTGSQGIRLDDVVCVRKP